MTPEEQKLVEDFLAGFAKQPTEKEKAENYLQQKYPNLFPNWKK
jgi:hypothetical protein